MAARNYAWETTETKPSDAATYERARRLANVALWTVDIQRRRLNSTEPEDKDFPLRPWSDFQFLIVALARLRRAAELAAKVPSIRSNMRAALRNFDAVLPHLKTMRDVAEHIDDYGVDAGKDKNISRKSLEVSSWDNRTWSWLGFETDIDEALSAGAQLFEALKDCQSALSPTHKQSSR